MDGDTTLKARELGEASPSGAEEGQGRVANGQVPSAGLMFNPIMECVQLLGRN